MARRRQRGVGAFGPVKRKILVPSLETFTRDLTLGVRQLRRTPAFTLTALLTLGLCIGANTAIFSVVDAALFRPLPYPQPDRLSLVATRFLSRGADASKTAQDGETWEVVKRSAAALDCAAFSDNASGVNLAIGDVPDYARQQRVSAGFFRVLGVPPARGREFTPEEDRAGGPAVTVLSDRLWRRLFHADPAVVGRALRLKGEPYTVVGIMPATFESGVSADLWTPLRPSASGEGGGSNYAIVARPRPGVDPATAEAAIEGLSGEALAHLQYPASAAARLSLMPLQGALTLDLRKPLFLLWGAVGLVLVIGCLNIAGLLLARAAARSREMATRAALGGGRAAIVSQLLAESLVLALLGGAAGVAFGALGIQALNRLPSGGLSLPRPVQLDARVVGMTAALSLLAVLLFGLFPALRASAVDLRSMLTERAGTAGGGQRWPRRLLVGGEVALSVVLLVLAGVLIRALLDLRSIPAGFDGTHTVAATLSLQDARYTADGRVSRLFTESLERIERLPDVEAAAVTLSLPYERWLNLDFKRLDGPPGSGETQITDLTYVTPGYFAALRVPVRRGRAFTDSDRDGSTPVAIVSQAFVRKYMPGEDPIGRHISIEDGKPCEIVGVAGDVSRGLGLGEHGSGLHPAGGVRSGGPGAGGPLPARPHLVLPQLDRPSAAAPGRDRRRHRGSDPCRGPPAPHHPVPDPGRRRRRLARPGALPDGPAGHPGRARPGALRRGDLRLDGDRRGRARPGARHPDGPRRHGGAGDPGRHPPRPPARAGRGRRRLPDRGAGRPVGAARGLGSPAGRSPHLHPGRRGAAAGGFRGEPAAGAAGGAAGPGGGVAGGVRLRNWRTVTERASPNRESPLSTGPASHPPLPASPSPVPVRHPPLPVSHLPAPAGHLPVPVSHSPVAASHPPVTVGLLPAPAGHPPLPVSHSPVPASHLPVPVSHLPAPADDLPAGLDEPPALRSRPPQCSRGTSKQHNRGPASETPQGVSVGIPLSKSFREPSEMSPRKARLEIATEFLSGSFALAKE